MAGKNRSSGAASTANVLDGAAEPDFFSRQITQARRFYLDLNPRDSQGLSVVCGGDEHCATDYHIARSGFRYLTIEFVARGEGTLRMAGQCFHLVTGATFAYGPDIPHDISCSLDRPLDKYFVNFTGNPAGSLLARGVLLPGQVVQSSAPAHIQEIFEELIAAGQRDTPFRSAICSAIVEHLILRIAETAVPLGTVGTEAFETYQRCRQYIDTHYRQLRSLAQIAEHCRVDHAYICRLFKRFAHQSPWQHVIRLKMRDAAQRLQMAPVLVSDVAYEFGFPDPFQFSRTFRRVFGMSPSRFVQLQRRQG